MKGIQNLLLLLLLPFCAAAQTATIDSLKKNIGLAATAEERKAAVFALCEQGYSLHPDTLMFYAETERARAIQSKNKEDEIRALFYESGALTTKGLLDSSLDLADECLEMMKGMNNPSLEGNLYNQKGRCFVRKNNYREAIEMGLRTIACAEKTKDVLLQIKGKTLIGWAYLEMGQLNDALSWHLKALRTTEDTVLLGKYAILFANLATNYDNLGIRDSAFYYIDKGVRNARQYENLFALSNSLAIESSIFVKDGQPKLSEPVLKEVVEIRKKIGDPFYIASDMAQLGYYYAHYGEPEKGIAICNEGIAIAKRYRLDTKLLFLYSSLADNYKAMGKTAEYASVLEDIINLKTNVYEKNSAEAIAEMQAKYESQRQENLIVRQKLDIQQKNYLFYGSVFILIFVSFLGWFIFREYRRRQKLKLLQVQEEGKIRSAVAVTKAEEGERKRIAADLHDNLGAYAAAIAGNVDRLVTGQNRETSVQELKINSQSIVSELNDTIWVLKKDNLSLTAISDRVKVFIQQISGSYPQVNIDVTEHINTDILLPPAQAFNLYRIAKEAVGNALKHSGAKNIRVCFESGTHWKLIIADDGRGMSVTDKFSSGNGLTNIKKRSKESDWSASWQANETGGTNVVIEPTTN